MVSVKLDRRAFDRPYRYETVEPGEHKVLWELVVPRDHAAFIRKVGVDWYNDTHWEWRMDGVLKERIQRTIEDVSSFKPDEYDPPLIAEKWIRFTFWNNSGAALTPGCLVEGELVKKA